MKKFKLLMLAGALTLAVPVLHGCSAGATQREQTVTVTTHPEDPDYGQADVTTTKTVTTTTEKRPDSVLGATAHAVGTIILLPFRLVGDALGLLV